MVAVSESFFGFGMNGRICDRFHQTFQISSVLQTKPEKARDLFPLPYNGHKLGHFAVK